MRKLAAILLGLALLTGCAVGPNYEQPQVPAPDQYREVQGPPAPAPSLADRPWWELFEDETLQKLIDEALRNGYDVQLAAWRVEEARARAGIARSEFWPQIGVGAQWSRGRQSIYLPPYSTATTNLNSVNVNFGWELDLWGRIRRSERGREGAIPRDRRRPARRSSLPRLGGGADVLSAPRPRRGAADREGHGGRLSGEPSISSSRKLAEGAASALETSYASAALNQVAAQVPEIERRIEATENQLNLLLGRNPAPIPRGQELAAQTVPPEVPAGLPSELLQRRPDIRQAEQDLVAANAFVGVAIANFFPQFSLTGLFGAVGPELDNFFYPAGKAWSIAAGLGGAALSGRTASQRVRRGLRAVGAGAGLLRADGHERLRRDDDRPLRAREDRRAPSRSSPGP